MTALERMKTRATGKKPKLYKSITGLKAAPADKLAKVSIPKKRKKRSKKRNITSALKGIGKLFKYDPANYGFGSMDRYAGGEYSLGYKKGGRIRKKKRATKRGHRSELRGG